MTGRDRTRLAAALLLGAALAFPAGMWAAREGDPRAPERRRPAAEMREVFSPSVRDDPYVVEELRRQVEILEAHCRDTGEMCAQARASRAGLERSWDRR